MLGRCSVRKWRCRYSLSISMAKGLARANFSSLNPLLGWAAVVFLCGANIFRRFESYVRSNSR
jgi:hypothetical protein